MTELSLHIKVPHSLLGRVSTAGKKLVNFSVSYAQELVSLFYVVYSWNIEVRDPPIEIGIVKQRIQFIFNFVARVREIIQ